MVINMKKNTFKFSFYLLSFSFLAKILSFYSRILLARNLDMQAMSYYSILSPTIVILISVVQLGIPNALSKLVAEKNYQFNIVSTSIYFTIFTTTVTSLMYLFLIPFLSALFFKEKLFSLFYSVLPFLPLIALSGLLKGYLMGKQHFISASFSQIMEEIARILFLLFCFFMIPNMTSIQLARIAILSISVGELCSTIFLFITILITSHITISKLPYSSQSLKQILNLSLPMSASRFIGSFTYFLEPIFMNLFIDIISAKKMILAYGIINGYVLPLITMPSFVTVTLSNFLLPSFTYHYSRNQHRYAFSLFYKISYISLLFGILYGVFLFCNSEWICQLFYHTTNGAYYLKICSLPFILYSLQPVLSNILHALSKSKESTMDTLFGCMVRLILVVFFSSRLKEMSLILGLVLGMLTTTLFHMVHFLHVIKKRNIL